MADLNTLRQWLVEAETARHRLMTGALEVSVSVGGFGATTYAATDLDILDTYIAKLKTDIARAEGRSRRGPVLMRF